MFSFDLLANISLAGIAEEIATITGRVPSPEHSANDLRVIFSCMDLTTLEGTDNAAKITTFCEKARAFRDAGLPLPAAVCIYPPFISHAKRLLSGTPVRIATTAAAFPTGQLPLTLKLEEIRYALDEGADEVDVVISRGTFLAGEYDRVYDELAAMKALTGNITLKVILETGELKSHENIAKASEIAIRAGADFIKTSTGKINPAATEDAVFVMLSVINAWYGQTGKRIGLKPAGGIAEPPAALNYLHLVRTVAGEEWLTPELFRIGASRLADRLSEVLK